MLTDSSLLYNMLFASSDYSQSKYQQNYELLSILKGLGICLIQTPSEGRNPLSQWEWHLKVESAQRYLPQEGSSIHFSTVLSWSSSISQLLIFITCSIFSLINPNLEWITDFAVYLVAVKHSGLPLPLHLWKHYLKKQPFWPSVFLQAK